MRRAAVSPGPDPDDIMTRILIVEDEPTIAVALRDDLELEGYAVDVVTDGDRNNFV